MNIRRVLSYLAVAVLAAIIYSTWVKEYPKKNTKESQVTRNINNVNSQESFAPSTFSPDQKAQSSKTATPEALQNLTSDGALKNEEGLIHVNTDFLQVAINLKGGTVDTVALKKYPVSITEKNVPIKILSNQSKNYYVAQSGLTNIGKGGKTSPIQYQTSQMNYALSPNEKSLVVSLTGNTKSGLKITKEFIFTKGSYVINLQYKIENRSPREWQGSLYTQLTRKQPDTEGHTFYTRSYDGAAISSPETPYQKVKYSDMDKSNVDHKNEGGWVAMQQHYFLSSWVPSTQRQMNYFYSHVMKGSGRNIYTIGFVSPALNIAKGQTQTAQAKLYVGPEIAKNLNVLAPGLERTIDYGWLWWFSIVIFWIMSMVHYVLGNWGWAIVITTIFIKIILYPLSATSFRSMARMRELQPKMQRLREQYGDDRQALSRATMELYKKEKINPVGGCLPMLIQIPVFIALYFVIIEAVQFRQAPFILWIHDLSVKDPYYVLPILMGLSMLLQQKLSPTSPDPTQAKVMMIIPVVFTFFFINFPAGLTLYWLVNNCVQIAQQWWVNKTMDAHMAKKERKRKKKSKIKNIFK